MTTTSFHWCSSAHFGPNLPSALCPPGRQRSKGGLTIDFSPRSSINVCMVSSYCAHLHGDFSLKPVRATATKPHIHACDDTAGARPSGTRAPGRLGVLTLLARATPPKGTSGPHLPCTGRSTYIAQSQGCEAQGGRVPARPSWALDISSLSGVPSCSCCDCASEQEVQRGDRGVALESVSW